MISIGIDVGKKGAITFINKEKTLRGSFVIPLVKTEIDVNALADILKKLHSNHTIGIVGVEDVHSIFGASSKANFQFGRCLGLIEGVVSSLGISCVKVTPKNWQKEMWEGIPPIKINTGKKSKNGEVKYKVDTKATSLLAAKKLFPGEDFLATSRSSVPHDGIVDGLLIAEYCRRKFL